MRNIKQLSVLTSLVICLCAGQQVAAETGEFYFGADVGRTHFSGDGPRNDSLFIAGQNFGGLDTCYGLHLGFQFNNWFAAELGYSDFGKATDRFKLRSDVIFIVSPNDTQSVSAKGASVSGVFGYKLFTHFSIFGVLGVMAMDYEATQSGGFSPVTGISPMKSNASDQGLVYGVGAKYALNDSLNLRVDARRTNAGDFALSTLSTGVEYTF
ncbi:MAG: hypothetical protein EOO53_06125 [Gammaproteobacteria bacterium]|nr:MAG: hypothetical protein EOO53_06125 [Gammaproteobacteria bacterium]